MAIKTRDKLVQSRITTKEFNAMKRMSDKANLTVSDWIRLRIQIGIDTRIQ